MVDTVRTEVELLTIFQDGQADGSISAQDLRDFIISVKTLTPPAYAGLSSNLTNNLGAINTPEYIAFNTQDAISGITHSTTVSNTEVQFDRDGVYQLTFSAEVMTMPAGAAQNIFWFEHWNGTIWELMDDTTIFIDTDDNNIHPVTLSAVHPFSAPEKVRVGWQGTTTDTHLHVEAATANYPAAPSSRLIVAPLTLT